MSAKCQASSLGMLGFMATNYLCRSGDVRLLDFLASQSDFGGNIRENSICHLIKREFLTAAICHAFGQTAISFLPG